MTCAFTAILVAMVCASGCALTPETRTTELAWQAANVIDGVQTSQYRVNDCYESGDWKVITGREPTIGATVLAAGISAALHYGITYALERYNAPRGLRRAWSYTSLALTAAQVAFNASLECTR